MQKGGRQREPCRTIGLGRHSSRSSTESQLCVVLQEESACDAMRCEEGREGGIGSLKAKSTVSGNFDARGRLVRQLEFGLKIGGEPCRDGNWKARCLKRY